MVNKDLIFVEHRALEKIVNKDLVFVEHRAVEKIVKKDLVFVRAYSSGKNRKQRFSFL